MLLNFLSLKLYRGLGLPFSWRQTELVIGRGKLVNYKRSRRSRSVATLPGSLPSNVVSFSASRKKVTAPKAHTIFYINESLDCAPLLESLGDIYLVDIHNPETLTRKLLIRIPDVILVESGIEWSDALTTVRQMTDLMAAPVVLLVGENSIKEDPDLIRKAYAAGVSDTLFMPLDQEEVFQTLNVLLHFQAQASLR